MPPQLLERPDTAGKRDAPGQIARNKIDALGITIARAPRFIASSERPQRVGAAFAVLIAEELLASGCRLLISMTSAGQILPVQAPPYFIIVDARCAMKAQAATACRRRIIARQTSTRLSLRGRRSPRPESRCGPALPGRSTPPSGKRKRRSMRRWRLEFSLSKWRPLHSMRLRKLAANLRSASPMSRIKWNGSRETSRKALQMAPRSRSRSFR